MRTLKSWWRGRSFKARLAIWYAASICVVLAIFAGITFEIVEHRLAAELDRQLRIDFDIVEAQLDARPDGSFAWPVVGHWRPFEWFSEVIGLLSTVGILYLIVYRQ